MSHELRTPLNSLLILAKVLSDDSETNLTEKQLEFARTIYSSGSDLLKLINEVLDLAKVEAGKMPIDPREVSIANVTAFVRRSFRPVADEKGLDFTIENGGLVPDEIRTDPQRVEQILKNLLANAFKFTDRGGVKFRIDMAAPDTDYDSDSLKIASNVVAMSV